MNSLLTQSLQDVFLAYEKEQIYLPTEIQNQIQKNISSVLKQSLSGIDKTLQQKRDQMSAPFVSDTMIFGDIHGELRLFMQNLWLAGVIDSNGNYDKEKHKTVIQLGDFVDREGRYPFEAMIYMRVLQRQAELANGKVILLFGNHEKFAFTRQEWWNENKLSLSANQSIVMRPYIRDILLSDVKAGRVQLCYGDKDASFMCFHGRLSKPYLLQVISHMYQDPKYSSKMKAHDSDEFFKSIQDATEYQKDLKISLRDVYSHLERCGITVQHIAEYMNACLIQQIDTPDVLESSFLTRENEGTYGREKKGDKNPMIPKGMEGEKYTIKPIQFGGHTPTTTQYPGRNASGIGFGILQNRTSIYTDADMVKGYQAFVGIRRKTGTVFAYELRNSKGMLLDTGNDKNFYSIQDKLTWLKIRCLEGINVNHRRGVSSNLSMPNTSAFS